MTTTTKINGTKVACTRKVKTSNEDKVGTEVAWTFDFKDAPIDKIYELATRTLVIDVQREYRAASPTDRKALITKNFSVKDILAGRKKKADPVKKAASLLDGMTEADRAEILAKYMQKS